MDYVGKLVAGAGEEAPLNRIVGGVYGVLANEIEMVAQWIVGKLKHAVDKVAQAAATSWVPGYGWVKIIDAVRDAIQVFNEAQRIMAELEAVVRTVQAIVDIAQDPVGALQDAAQAKLDEKLEPIKDKIDEYGRRRGRRGLGAARHRQGLGRDATGGVRLRRRREEGRCLTFHRPGCRRRCTASMTRSRRCAAP